MTEVLKSQCMSDLMPIMQMAQLMRSSFPLNYDVKRANEDNHTLTVYLRHVYHCEMGITPEGGDFLVHSGLGMTLAKAYYCARKYYFAMLTNAQESENARNAYVSVANFWWNWRPIIMEMKFAHKNAVILKEIKKRDSA